MAPSGITHTREKGQILRTNVMMDLDHQDNLGLFVSTLPIGHQTQRIMSAHSLLVILIL